MKNIKTFEQFINESELNEAKNSASDVYKMMDEATDNIQKLIGQLDDVRGYINDNYEVAEIKKMKGYQVLLDSTKELSKLKDKLNNTVFPDKK